MKQIYCRNHKLLRQIILTSYLSSLSIILAKVFNTFDHQLMTFTNIMGLKIFKIDKDFLVYVQFLPLILMSFYVPWYLSCMGASLADVIIFYLITKSKIFAFEPLANLFSVIFFALLPGLLLQKKDHFFKFYLVIVIISGLWKICNWYFVFKYRFKIIIIQSLNPMGKILTQIIELNLFIRCSLVFVTSFLIVILLKELFKRLQFLTDAYELDKK